MYACRLPRAVYAGEGALEILSAPLIPCEKVAVFGDRGVEKAGGLARPLALLRRAGHDVALLLDLPAEPTCEQAQEAVDAFRETGAGAIVAIGGGSVMDVAKLCSVVGREHTVRELLDDASLARRSGFAVMVPTTAGTGAEATPNSIVAVPEKALKVGIVSDEMLPDAVVLDGELLRGLPAGVAASTGVDALCHAIECFTSRKATPFSDLYALEALRLIFDNIEPACLEAGDMAAKNAMLRAAYYAGVAISCSGTTAVHALSYPLGGKYRIPHGVANAMLLMPVMRFNFDACREDLARVYDGLGRTGAADKAAWVLGRMEDIVRALHIPTRLDAYGVSTDDLDSLVAAGMDVQRLLVNNKRRVTAVDARRLYRELLEGGA